MRDAHLPQIETPMLFIQGSCDARAPRSIGALHVVEGADHGLKVRGRTEDDLVSEIAGVSLRWIQDLR